MRYVALFMVITSMLIWAMGSSIIRITDFPNHEMCPRLSPDGTRLAYAEVSLDGPLPVANIRIATYDGQNPMLATDRSTEHQYPTWFPNNAQVAYEQSVIMGPKMENYEIWSVPINAINGSKLVQNSYNFSIMPDMSSKGDALFVSSANMNNPFPAFPPMRYGGVPPEAAVMDEFYVCIQPQGQQVIIKSIPGLYPRWNPAGTRIAYCAWNPTTNWDIFIADYLPGTGLSNFRQITSDPGDEFCPCWSPNGEWVAYAYAIPGKGVAVNIYLVNITDGTKIQETFEDAVVTSPDWGVLPNGDEYVYFASDMDGDFDIYRVKPMISATSPIVRTPSGSLPPPGQLPIEGSINPQRQDEAKYRIMVLNASYDKVASEAQGYAEKIAKRLVDWSKDVFVTGIINGNDSGEPHVYYTEDKFKQAANQVAMFLDGLLKSGVLGIELDYSFYPAEPISSSPYKVSNVDIIVEAPAN